MCVSHAISFFPEPNRMQTRKKIRSWWFTKNTTNEQKWHCVVFSMGFSKCRSRGSNNAYVKWWNVASASTNYATYSCGYDFQCVELKKHIGPFWFEWLSWSWWLNEEHCIPSQQQIRYWWLHRVYWIVLISRGVYLLRWYGTLHVGIHSITWSSTVIVRWSQFCCRKLKYLM